MQADINMIASHFDFNQQFAQAYDLLENSKNNVFITGQAGTGKSTLLKYFREHTSKDIIVLAPTGVAAVNIMGQTIHSFFRFRPDITPESVADIRIQREDREIYQNIDTIIIDEISMVRADLLDCVDAFLKIHGKKKKKSFGGIQMIFIGDLYQLPPVVRREEEHIFRGIYSSPYFFSSKVFGQISVEFIDLAKIYRQQDDDFIELLKAIRNKEMSDTHLKVLNERCDPVFYPDENDLYVYLTTTNKLADQINKTQLSRLEGKLYHFEGSVDGKFENKNLPTHEFLDIKIGAQVMLLNNDTAGRWINGSIGKVLSISGDLTATAIIEVQLDSGSIVEVSPFRWEMFRFYFNEETRMIESESVGSFTQYPLKLAWAVTIHKSQGKTFSKVIIDIGTGTFAHGQTYVALSRCTSLEGIILRKPIYKRHILLDGRIVDFMEQFSNE